jgi:hypothetical protein
MKKILWLVVWIPVFVLGCVSADDSFLVQKLDDQSKSQALTAEGIDQYQLYVVKNRDFEQIGRIREYFNTALRFDPANTQAQQYLGMIDSYRAQQVKVNLAAATKLLAKPKRTDDDIYQLAVYMQTAISLDPRNTDAQKMLAQTSDERSKLIDGYLAKARASIAGVDDKSTTAVREKAYTDAFASVSKTLDVDPRSGPANSLAGTIKAELSKMVSARVAAIGKLVAAAKYTDARSQLTGLSDLNRKAGNAFDADVSTQTYSVNFTWANALFGQKDYITAESRVDAALAVKRTGEATALKRKLVDLHSKMDSGASFDTALQTIDKAIAAGDLVSAHRLLETVANTTTDQSKLSQLDDRDQQILDALKAIYDQGVQAYRDEDFKTAIDRLQVVVSIKVDYEQAADYLDKAKSKQKLLDKS